MRSGPGGAGIGGRSARRRISSSRARARMRAAVSSSNPPESSGNMLPSGTAMGFGVNSAIQLSSPVR